MPLVDSYHRSQLMMLSLEERITEDNFVRVIDAFVDSLNYINLGFIVKGKSHEGSPVEDARQINDANVLARKNEYKRPQAIVEHPSGTIKLQLGYTYTLMKGLQNVNTEFSLIHLCYNLKRVTKILGLKDLLRALITKFAFW